MGHDIFLSEVCISTSLNFALFAGLFQWLSSLSEIDACSWACRGHRHRFAEIRTLGVTV